VLRSPSSLELEPDGLIGTFVLDQRIGTVHLRRCGRLNTDRIKFSCEEIKDRSSAAFHRILG
jgi:hypothetical protein